MTTLLTLILLAGPAPGATPRAVLDTWLSAQNTANFAAYEGVFATKFQGVKRSGQRTYRFDRKGWLKDRKRMFSPKVKVEMSDVQERALGKDVVQFSFTQKWSSGKYEDVGTKLITVFREGGGWNIAREEMLTSDIKLDLTKQAPLTPVEFAAVWDGRVQLGGLGAVTVDPKRLSTHAVDGVHVAFAPVDPAQLGAAEQAWIGRKVRVYDAAGRACETSVTGLVAQAAVVPHFGVVQEMQEGGGEGWAQAVWELAPETQRLAGTLADKCEGGLWARDAAQPAATPWPVTTDPALAQKATAALRKLPGYRALQKDFSSDGSKGFWESSGSGLSFASFAGPDGAQVVSALALGGICGGFGGQFESIWSVAGGQWTAVTDPKSGGPEAEVIAAATLGPGQAPVLLLREWMSGTLKVARRVGDRYEIIGEWSIAYQDCPC